MITNSEISDLEKDINKLKTFITMNRFFCVWRNYLFYLDISPMGRICPSKFNNIIIKSYPFNRNYISLKRDIINGTISYKDFTLDKFIVSNNIIHNKIFEIFDFTYLSNKQTNILFDQSQFLTKEIKKSSRLYKIKLLKGE